MSIKIVISSGQIAVRLAPVSCTLKLASCERLPQYFLRPKAITHNKAKHYNPARCTIQSMDDAAIALDKPVNTHDQQATTQPAQDTPGNPKCSDGEVSINKFLGEASTETLGRGAEEEGHDERVHAEGANAENEPVGLQPSTSIEDRDDVLDATLVHATRKSKTKAE